MTRFEIILVCLLSLCLGLLAHGGVNLSWVPSPDPNVNAYRLYAWTNAADTNCMATNAVEILTLGNGTNATLEALTPAPYTFALTALDTNSGAESPFSNFAYWQVPVPPTFLVTVQCSSNLLTWTNTQMFFRLKIAPE